MPPVTIGPTSWRRYSNWVTTPKFPPPPRSPHRSSWFSSSLARTTRPSAVTISAASRLCDVKPYIRSSQPLPAPSVRPAMPVVVMRPPVVASPCACVAASNSPQVTPAWARTTRASGSTSIRFSGERSSMIPSSQTACPLTPWPPPLTESGRPVSRASRMPATTSAAPEQRTISRGRRSIIALKTVRASSYPSSPGSRSSPVNRPRMTGMVDSSRIVLAMVASLGVGASRLILPPRRPDHQCAAQSSPQGRMRGGAGSP